MRQLTLTERHAILISLAVTVCGLLLLIAGRDDPIPRSPNSASVLEKGCCERAAMLAIPSAVGVVENNSVNVGQRSSATVPDHDAPAE